MKPSLRESLSNLGLEYLDLYLMHWPHAFKVSNYFVDFESRVQSNYHKVQVCSIFCSLVKRCFLKMNQEM